MNETEYNFTDNSSFYGGNWVAKHNSGAWRICEQHRPRAACAQSGQRSLVRAFPVGIWCKNDVVSTSFLHHVPAGFSIHYTLYGTWDIYKTQNEGCIYTERAQILVWVLRVRRYVKSFFMWRGSVYFILLHFFFWLITICRPFRGGSCLLLVPITLSILSSTYSGSVFFSELWKCLLITCFGKSCSFG